MDLLSMDQRIKGHPMLSRAFGSLGLAQFGIQQNDEATHCLSCAQITQAFEFALKDVILTSGTTFPKTHDILKLMESVERHSWCSDSLWEDLELRADTLTKWYVESRYNFDFKFSHDRAVVLLNLVRAFLLEYSAHLLFEIDKNSGTRPSVKRILLE